MTKILKAMIDIEVPMEEGMSEEEALMEVSNLIHEINGAMYPIRSNKIVSHDFYEETSSGQLLETRRRKKISYTAEENKEGHFAVHLHMTLDDGTTEIYENRRYSYLTPRAAGHVRDSLDRMRKIPGNELEDHWFYLETVPSV